MDRLQSQGMITRRRAIAAMLSAAGVGLTGLYTWRVEPHWLEFTYPELPIRNLPPELRGGTLAQITDTHVGPEVDDDYVIEAFRRTRQQSPDYVVYTGDWVSFRDERQFGQLRRVLEHLPHGRLGTVGILGNHDYGRRWRMLEVAEQISQIAERAGVTILRNSEVTMHGLKFVGLDDYWSPRFDPAPVLTRNATDYQNAPPTIVLSHNPDSADEPVWSGYKGWILAGHTHGGQCKPPFLPPPELPVKNRRYTSGAFDLSGGRRMYISRGVGHLLRVRFNARPEIPIFRLQSERT
jgi:predicted MPP superfamily phosphohydrolase